MKLVKLLAIGTVLVCVIFSCRKKEVFPDLAKQMQGDYLVTQVNLAYYAPTAWNTGTYNPKDSAQVGRIIIRKIDALSVNVQLVLKKQSGQFLFEDNFDCELSRDINNKGWIHFYTYNGQAGSFIVDDGSVGYNYLSMGSRTQHGRQASNVSAGFTAKL